MKELLNPNDHNYLYLFIQRNEYVEALQWYNYSWSIFTSEEKENTNLSKLHRNRAFCLLNNSQHEKVKLSHLLLFFLT